MSLGNQKVVVEKGYTVEVVSWENDGDHYETSKQTVNTKEEALKLAKITNELFKELGNEMDREVYTNLILSYVSKNSSLFPQLNSESDEDEILDVIGEIQASLVGFSEHYLCRVVESISITYSPENVYAEIVDFT